MPTAAGRTRPANQTRPAATLSRQPPTTEKTMQFLDPVDPSKCCHTDGFRYLLTGVCIRGEKAIATDGRILIVTAIRRGENDDPAREALIPARAVAIARRKSRRASRKHVYPEIDIQPVPENSPWPTVAVHLTTEEIHAFREIIPATCDTYPEHAKAVGNPAAHTLRIGLNVRLLSRLAAAMGHDSLTLHIDPSKIDDSGESQSTILATANDCTEPASPHTMGAIMPIRHTRPITANLMAASYVPTQE